MNSDRKSVLFLLGRFTVGGVERVTVTMANAFASAGWHVCVAAFEFVNRDLLSSLDKAIVVEELGLPAFRMSKIPKLRALMKQNGVSYIVNQWALPFPLTVMLRLAMPKGTKLIAFHHTMPNRNGRLQGARGIKRKIITWASKISLRLVYRSSHAYVVLSKSLMPVFQEFTGLKSASKLTWLPNPLAVSEEMRANKEDRILYVGRMSQIEKRVDRVIEVWRLVSAVLPDWKLDVLGDGPDREDIERMAEGLPNITFHGFCNSKSFYDKAKVLWLTSDFEGFPMVVVEAMAAGCAPVVLGSFPTAKDIVQENTGIVVDVPWNARRFADATMSIINDSARWELLSSNAKNRVQEYSVENVLKMYLALFDRLDGSVGGDSAKLIKKRELRDD